MKPHLTVGIWNTEWRDANSVAGEKITEMLLAYNPDVVCITEGHLDQMPANWHCISCEADHGYRPLITGRRKVLLFSRSPWLNTDSIGIPSLPSGRFVAATTNTAIGPIRFVGVCIPWAGAHVKTGTRNRVRWQDHKDYLLGLRTIIENLPNEAIILGDFNQQVPRKWNPADTEKLLHQALGRRFKVVTSGMIPDVSSSSIDHLACHRDLSVESLHGLPKKQNNIELSDHIGLILKLQRKTDRTDMQ